MRVAIPDWHGQVSPVFDAAGRLLVIDLGGGAWIHRRVELLTGLTPVGRVHRLHALGVDTLVCGAISNEVEHQAVSMGIRVVSLVSGPVDTIARIVAAGQSIPASCLLPGCVRARDRPGARNRKDGSREERLALEHRTTNGRSQCQNPMKPRR